MVLQPMLQLPPMVGVGFVQPTSNGSLESRLSLMLHSMLAPFYIFSLNFLIPLYDFSLTLQMELLHSLMSNTNVIYHKIFPDHSHSQKEIIVFPEF